MLEHWQVLTVKQLNVAESEGLLLVLLLLNLHDSLAAVEL